MGNARREEKLSRRESEQKMTEAQKHPFKAAMKEFTLANYFAVLKRTWWKVLLAFAGVLILRMVLIALGIKFFETEAGLNVLFIPTVILTAFWSQQASVNVRSEINKK
jgi:hypothetical protein